MNTRSTLASIGIVVALIAIIWFFFLRPSFDHEPVKVLPPSTPRASAPPPSAPTQAESVVAPPAPVSASPISCRDQELSIAVADNPSQRACFGTTVVLQNGSLRSYRVDNVGDKGWELKIDAIAEKVESATLRSKDNLSFACAEGNCPGITISKHDSQGARTITLQSLLQQSSGPAVAEAIPARKARVSGKLRTLPEGQVPGMACPGQGVTIIANDGGTTALCPSGGAGFEITDDGGRRFEFSSADTGTIYVTVDAAEVLQKIDYESGTLACASAECGGVSISPPNEKGERVFTFANTTLREVVRDGGKAAGRFVVISGKLILPGDL